MRPALRERWRWFPSRPLPSANAYLVSGPGVLSLDRACRGGVARCLFGGIGDVVQARPHGFNASTVVSRELSRRRAPCGSLGSRTAHRREGHRAS
jgi:hypothetical protein